MPDQLKAPGERSAVASYVATLSADLATMARDTGLETLGYLLEMVRLEAESSARQNHGPNGRPRTRLADYPFVEYGVYDIDRAPVPQAIDAGSIDVVIAGNVVHNARDLAQTLRHLHGALARDGLLVLVENTVNEPFHMVTVGFYQDFGNYADGRRLPLLGPDDWSEVLRAAGYPTVEVIPGPGVESFGQHVIVAQPVAQPGVLPGAGTDVDPGTLRAALARLLPSYLVPTHYKILDRTPLGPNGKVDIAAVPSPWDGAPVARMDPRGAWEQQIFDIWRETLARDDFGVADNFFELGGDSLHGIRIIARLREDLGVCVSADEGLQILFDGPTVAEMASVLRRLAG